MLGGGRVKQPANPEVIDGKQYDVALGVVERNRKPPAQLVDEVASTALIEHGDEVVAQLDGEPTTEILGVREVEPGCGRSGRFKLDLGIERGACGQGLAAAPIGFRVGGHRSRLRIQKIGFADASGLFRAAAAHV